MIRILLCAATLLALPSCVPMMKPETSIPQTKTPEFTQASFADLPNWSKDQMKSAFIAFDISCEKLSPSAFASSSLPIKDISKWTKVCAARPSSKTITHDEARQYFETYFTPYLVTADGQENGLFTGYFEASLNGSLKKTDQFSVPLRERPSDLIMVDLGDFRPELKGQRIAGRAIDGKLKVYEDRAAIEDGKLPPAQDKPLLWVDNAVDAFFLQVQGSGVVTLPDGSTKRVGYDGQNGHVYSAIGGELIRRGHLTKDNVSMQSIKTWMAQNPVEAIDIMRTNKSYVFFRFIDGDHKVSGPIGGQGVPLTAERSLAIDHGIYPYGVPFFLDAAHPTNASARLQQLMIAQDTGGAIKGVVRGDVFWGHGDYAEQMAGPMKSPGRFWILLPK